MVHQKCSVTLTLFLAQGISHHKAVLPIVAIMKKKGVMGMIAQVLLPHLFTSGTCLHSSHYTGRFCTDAVQLADITCLPFQCNLENKNLFRQFLKSNAQIEINLFKDTVELQKASEH